MNGPLHFVDARLIDPEGETEMRGALRVEGGRIADIAVGPVSPSEGRVVDCGGHALAPGLIDARVFVTEPGARHRESYRSAGDAAAAGGVTTFVAQPDTQPPLDDPALVQFTLARAREASVVRVHVMAALTRGLQGREMTEQGFLLDAGAVALTDGDRVVADSRVFAACLKYATATGALIVHRPDEPSLSAGASATAGEFASRLGLPAVPAIAERIGLDRDLTLAGAAGARLHAAAVTTEASLAVLARAMEAGDPVSGSVSVHHVTLNEFDLADYRSFFKLTPPLRAEADREAAVEGLSTGVLSVLHSSHLPWDEEAKRLPFEAAAAGAVGLETLLPGALRLYHAGRLPLPRLIARMTLGPARLLGLPQGRLKRGAPADLVLFDPDAPYVLDRARLRSKSKNTPFDRQRMQGRVLGTWVGGARVFG